MSITLIESQDVRSRWRSQAVLSATIHATLITLAVLGTPGMTRTATGTAERVNLAQLTFSRRPPQPARHRPRRMPAAVRAVRREIVLADAALVAGFQVLVAPVDIPSVIPDIDLIREVTDEMNFGGRGAARGVADEYAPALAPTGDNPYLQSQVERQATPNGGCSPRFPRMLSEAGVEGTVLAEFVIDTTGRAVAASFKALSSNHELFDRSVRKALGCMRYLPAEVGGRKVRQLVQQPFAFVLANR